VLREVVSSQETGDRSQESGVRRNRAGYARLLLLYSDY